MSKRNGSMKPNKYGGPCDRCKGRVESGEGLLAGKVRGVWRVRHVQCNHEGARQVGPPMMSTGHSVAALAGPACGLTGVPLDPGVGSLEGRNLDRRIRAAQEVREGRADEEEHARSLPAQFVAGL